MPLYFMTFLAMLGASLLLYLGRSHLWPSHGARRRSLFEELSKRISNSRPHIWCVPLP